MKKRTLVIVFLLISQFLNPIVAFSEIMDQHKGESDPNNLLKEEMGKFNKEPFHQESTYQSNAESEEEKMTEHKKKYSEIVDEGKKSNESIKESERSVSSVVGTWGSVSWSYSEMDETITLSGGVAGPATAAPWKTYTSVKKIVINDGQTPVLLPEISSQLFSNLRDLEVIENANRLDVSNVTGMEGMFLQNIALKELDISNWNIGNVRSLRQLFDGASSLASLDISGWNTENVENMSHMFRNTTSLEVLDIGSWNTSKVTDMSWMFFGASSLRYLDLSEWDTSNVTSMGATFYDNSRLVELDVSSWETSKVSNMTNLFDGASSLTSLDLSSWDTSRAVKTNMFARTTSLKTLILGEKSVFDSWVNLPNIDTQGYTGEWVLSDYLDEQSKNIVFSSSATFMSDYDGSHPGAYTWKKEMINGMWGTVPWVYDDESETITLYGGEAGSVTTAPWKTHSSVEKIIVQETVKLPSSSSMLFNMLDSLQSIQGGEKFDTSNVTDMSNMFTGASSLSSIEVGSWNTSNVTNMFQMFALASSLSSIEVDGWNTTNVTNMSSMFAGASSLSSIEVGSWNTSNVTNMSQMFAGASSLSSIEVDGWNTTNVTNMFSMFFGASSLSSIEVGSWNTSNVTNMSQMFAGASSLSSIEVDSWNTTNVTNMSSMFQECKSLESLDLSSWDTSQVTNMQRMFGNTNALNRITLGEQSIFSAATNLPAIPSAEQYTGRWTLEENLSGDGSVITFENSTEFMANYDGSSPGTYIWERVAPEQLVASIDRVSDQSQTITGYATESVDELIISYQTMSGDKVVLEKDDPRIVWGDYQESNQQVRQFQIDLIGNERLETETKVTITVSKPSVETTGDKTEEQTVIKGIDYQANNLTLDRFKINELSTQEELDALILQESRAQAANVLTEADMTDDFRIVETDLTRGVDEDGSYFAVLEVGNKAYQMTIGIDVTSKLEHMRVTIPTKMVFESLYNTAESNRNFESQGYEIRNQSPLAVDTYINQLAIDDPASIVLLEEGEDPLDYAESEEEYPTLTYDDISTPLLRLNLRTEETQIQLYETMEEQHLVRLEERSRVPISLTGDFYGDYPQWIVDTEADQGGYYEDLLVPKYRIVLRFVPRD